MKNFSVGELVLSLPESWEEVSIKKTIELAKAKSSAITNMIDSIVILAGIERDVVKKMKKNVGDELFNQLTFVSTEMKSIEFKSVEIEGVTYTLVSPDTLTFGDMENIDRLSSMEKAHMIPILFLLKQGDESIEDMELINSRIELFENNLSLCHLNYIQEVFLNGKQI